MHDYTAEIPLALLTRLATETTRLEAKAKAALEAVVAAPDPLEQMKLAAEAGAVVGQHAGMVLALQIIAGER